MTRILIALGMVTLLTACSSIPREYTSPCACDWRPVGETPNAEVLA